MQKILFVFIWFYNVVFWCKMQNVHEKWFEGILFLVVFAPEGGMKGQQYILIVHALNKHICKQTSLDVRPPMPLKRGRFNRAYLFA